MSTALVDERRRDWSADDIQLAATAHAASVAVMFTQSTLKSWGLAVLSRTAEQVVRTLVGHAVTTTGIADEIPVYKAEHVNMLVLRVAHNDTTLHRGMGRHPQPPAGPAPAGHQSGYFLETGGKVVWTKIVYAEPHPAPLPRRTPSPVPRPAVMDEPTEPSSYANDTETMQRVRVTLQDL
jgi:hypothetical protein